MSGIASQRTQTGRLYLAAVMDLHSRKIIGWAISPTMPAELVCRALRMALGQRQPGAGLMLHPDRGSHNQWLAVAFGRQLSQMASCFINTPAMNTKPCSKQHGIICSMSRKGNCWDNAVMERFFLNLKMERVWQREYANQMEASKDVTEYIVGFYNCQRRHSALGNLAPMVYEQQFTAKKPIDVSVIT